MSDDKRKLIAFETALLNREVKDIDTQLAAIGVQLVKVFDKYGMSVANPDEMKSYLADHVLGTKRVYKNGKYITNPEVHRMTQTTLPKEVEEAIVNWAVADMINQMENIEEIATEAAMYAVQQQ